MSLLEKDSVHQADHAPGIIPDTNDPTAGQVHDRGRKGATETDK